MKDVVASRDRAQILAEGYKPSQDDLMEYATRNNLNTSWNIPDDWEKEIRKFEM